METAAGPGRATEERSVAAVDRRNLRRTWAERNLLVPDTDDEDTIRCGDTRRVDDEGSGKLGFHWHAPLQRAAGCGSPVVVSAQFARFEAHLLRSAGLQNEGILLAAGSFVQAMDRCSRWQRIVHDGVDLRALWHPNERARILQRSAPFAEGVYRESFAFLALGMPLPFAKL
jgi:hypothetical protein